MANSKKPKEEYVHTDNGIGGQYKTWFLDYASYVILERAVPAIEDGLKPVQRRILHAMKEMDDGRFNKVANIIGQSGQHYWAEHAISSAWRCIYWRCVGKPGPKRFVDRNPG